MTHQETIALRTAGPGDMHDITDDVHHIVGNSGVTTGIAHVFNVGSTAAIGAIEFESGLRKDLPDVLNQLIRADTHWGHEQAWHDGNGHSHLQATLLGPDMTIPVSSGNLVLGTWQQIFHIECDVRARDRTIVVTIIGD